MTARDELGRTIDGATDSWLYPIYGSASVTLADAILAAGYRKPRTITTVEELDALPLESVVRSAFGVTSERDCDFDTNQEFWSSIGSEDRYGSGKITLPATVLHEGNTR